MPLTPPENWRLTARRTIAIAVSSALVAGSFPAAAQAPVLAQPSAQSGTSGTASNAQASRPVDTQTTPASSPPPAVVQTSAPSPLNTLSSQNRLTTPGPLEPASSVSKTALPSTSLQVSPGGFSMASHLPDSAQALSAGEAALQPSALIGARTQEQDGTQRIEFAFDHTVTAPKVFELVAPRRVVLDFARARLDAPVAQSPLSLSGTGAQNVSFSEDDKRLRVVVMLRDDAQWSPQTDGKSFALVLKARPELAQSGAPTSVPVSSATPPTPLASQNSNGNASVGSLPTTGVPTTFGVSGSGAGTGANGMVDGVSMPLSQRAKEGGYSNDIVALDYRKGSNPGAGRLVIDFSQANPQIDIKEVKGGMRIDLLGSASAPWLLRQYDLSDQLTPATRMEINQLSDRTRIFLRATGDWVPSSFQLNRRLIVDLNPVSSTTLSSGDSSTTQYTGKKVTLSFQDAPVRQLLAVLADFSGLNIIASDRVDGNLTINLKEVPWDQALDLILQAKNLDKRMHGNVIWVAPKQDIRAQETQDALFAQEQAQNEPLVTESFQINYQKADEIRKLLSDPNQRILTKRGSAVVDARTNQVFVQDIPSKIEAARALIKKVDIPVRQVVIEAQIVEANDSFSKSLGVKFGLNGTAGHATLGGNLESNAYKTGQSSTATSFDDTLGVNLPVSSTTSGANAGVFSLVLSNSALTKFLNLELSALVSDGQGQVLSNPRVVTADQQEATISQGTQIPYQQASSAGNTNVAFKDAELSLKVKPQITPDGNVIMDLDVHKDTVGQTTTNGPAIDTKSIKTQVLVESGGTVVIGGIYVETETLSADKVPVLGDLPLVGALFRTRSNSRSRTELLIMITPKIITTTMGGNSDVSSEDTQDDSQQVVSHLISRDTLRRISNGGSAKSLLPDFGGKPTKELQYPNPNAQPTD